MDSEKIGKESRDDLVKEFLEILKEKYDLQNEDLIKLLQKEDTANIPCSIFNEKLGSLESIVKYLKEEREFNYKKIAFLLHRKDGPIGVTYRNAKKKFDEKLNTDSKYFIPLTIFSNTKSSVLENIVSYLKSHYSLNFNEIANLLKRDYKTIWTVYQKFLKKSKLNKHEK